MIKSLVALALAASAAISFGQAAGGGVPGAAASAGVSSINGTSGAFIFSGGGVSCTTTTCVFSAGGTGTVTSFSAGTLAPVFTTSVATGTTTPALSFSLTSAASNTAFGNFTASSGAPSYTATNGTGAPVSTNSPALTGTPTVPTATAGTNTTQAASTAFVATAVAAVPSAPVSSVFTRTGAVVAASGDYTVSQVTGAAPLASPALTGTPTAPTQAISTNNTDLATTAAVTSALGSYAPLASPSFTGTPLVPTATGGTSTTQAASTAFVTSAVSGFSATPNWSSILSGTNTQTGAFSTAAPWTFTGSSITLPSSIILPSASQTTNLTGYTGGAGGNQGAYVLQFSNFTTATSSQAYGSPAIHWVGTAWNGTTSVTQGVHFQLFPNTNTTNPAWGFYINQDTAFPGGLTYIFDNPITAPSATLTGTLAVGAVKIATAQSTVSCSTSGTAIFSQPLQGTSDKKVLIHLAACLGTASYTYPTAFTNTPSAYASNNVAASIASTISTTAVTVTGATTTGSLILEDY